MVYGRIVTAAALATRELAARAPEGDRGNTMHEQAIAGQTVDLGPALEAELEALDREMPRIQSMAGNVFALASAWAERHAAILQRTPPPMRAAMEARLHRIGIRWGVVHGVRMTTTFPAIG